MKKPQNIDEALLAKLQRRKSKVSDTLIVSPDSPLALRLQKWQQIQAKTNLDDSPGFEEMRREAYDIS